MKTLIGILILSLVAFEMVSGQCQAIKECGHKFDEATESGSRDEDMCTAAKAFVDCSQGIEIDDKCELTKRDVNSMKKFHDEAC
ncbi:Uncharacterised protein g11294 [Pycnogonum litorale]